MSLKFLFVNSVRFVAVFTYRLKHKSVKMLARKPAVYILYEQQVCIHTPTDTNRTQ